MLPRILSLAGNALILALNLAVSGLLICWLLLGRFPAPGRAARS